MYFRFIGRHFKGKPLKHTNYKLNFLPRFNNFSPPPLENNKDKQKAPPPTESNAKIIKFIVQRLWPKNKKTFFQISFALSCLFASKLIAVQVPFLFKYAIDSLKLPNEVFQFHDFSLTYPVAILVGWGIAKTISSLFYEIRSVVFAPVAQSAVRSLTCETFSQLHKMDFSFLLTQSSGALSRTLDRGQRSIQYIINSMIFNLLPTAFEILLVCYLLGINCGAGYSLVTLSTIVIYSAFTLTVTKWRTKLRKMLNALDNKASSKAIDTFINFETIKYFNNEMFEVEKYERTLKNYHRVALLVQGSLAFLNWGQNFIFTMGLSSVMIMAAKGVQAGTMTVGDLVMVNGLLFQLSYPLHFIGSTYREIKQSLVDMQCMIQLLNATPKIREEEKAPWIKFKRGDLSFKNVKFSYEGDFEILRNISFDVPCGKSVAIVGLSGSGKSTLFRLLYRFFDPTEGSITIDGHDIRKISLECVRKAIGVVPQDVVLFNESIFYNIQYGCPGATREQVISAAKKAEIHESVIRMQKGYDTEVGERGIKLSGGEKQRIAIARMVLKNPRIILCDEATSSLDVDTEETILGAIKSFARNKTSIYIAHRLSAITDVDTILVVENGRLVEKGSYYSLMSIQGGRFQSMWEKQVRIKKSPDRG